MEIRRSQEAGDGAPMAFSGGSSSEHSPQGGSTMAPMSVRLRLLGVPAVEWKGESAALPFERRGQLVAYLALKRTWVPRAEIAQVLWPDLDSKLAYANLRKALHRLQSAPWAAGIESEGGALRFEVASDVTAFESALREDRAGEALELYRRPLLEGFEDAAGEAWSGWLAFER